MKNLNTYKIQALTMFRGHKTKLSDCFKVSERCLLTSVPPSYESITRFCSQSVLWCQPCFSVPQQTLAWMERLLHREDLNIIVIIYTLYLRLVLICLKIRVCFFFSLDMKQLKILHATHFFRNFKRLLPLNLLHLNRTFP